MGEAMRNVKPSRRSWCAAALLGVLLLAYPELGATEQKEKYEGPLWDAHGHLWSAVGFGLADYGTLMQELGVVAGNLSNIDFHPGGAEEGTRLAKRLFPSSVFPFVAVEIGAPPFDNMVKWVQQDPAFISEQLAKMETILAKGEAFGIGEIFTQWGQLMSLSGPSIPADSPGMMKLAELAARYKVPLQIHHTIIPIGDEKGGERFSDWERLLAKNPKTRFVMAHAGFTPSWISDGGPSGGPAKFREWLGKFPNLYVELSWASNGEYFKRGLFATPLPFNAKAIAPITTDGKMLRPEWKKLLEDFPDRFVAWGSDPTFNFNVEGKRQIKDKWELMEVVRLGVENGREILGQLPPELAARVAYKNGYALLFP